MYKYEIWNESGLLYDSLKDSEATYYDYHEAQYEAKLYIQSEVADANIELEIAGAEPDVTEDDYWYKIVELDPDVYCEYE
jgi:hypothetical protein